MSLRATSDWRLREAPFPFQQTYMTPLANRADPSTRSNLSRFVHSLLAPFEANTGKVCIELFVFEPTELIWYLRGLNITADEGQLNHATLIAENKTETYALLECVLGQWADFALFGDTQNFAIYADHDEYTTIFAAKSEALSSIRTAMQQDGFKEVEGWTWAGPHSQGKIEEGINV